MLIRWVRWMLTLVGGVVLGGGLVLHGQIAVVREMRDEVESTFFLWRAIGEATVFLQAGEVRVALALSELPEAALRESDVAAWTLVTVGALLALTAALLPPTHRHDAAARRPTRRKKA